MRVGEPDLGPVAEARLALSEQGQAERHFWRQLGDEAAATDGAVLAPADAPYDSVPDAVSALEAQLAATTGAAGVIHVPRWAASYYNLYGNPTADGRVLRTPLGTPVIAGGGYGYTGPDDTATDDVVWVYATGPVTVRRGAVQLYGGDSGGFDQRSNEVWHIAERPYLITAECPVLAAAASAAARPDTVWPVPEPRTFAMTVDASDPLNVTASFTGATCDEVRLSWGDGSDTVGVPVTDGAGSAAHNYETGGAPVTTKRAATAPKSRKRKG
jgi:hypothetical protein